MEGIWLQHCWGGNSYFKFKVFFLLKKPFFVISVCEPRLKTFPFIFWNPPPSISSSASSDVRPAGGTAVTRLVKPRVNLTAANTTWVSTCQPRALSAQQRERRRRRRRDVKQETKPCHRHGPALWAAQVHLVWFHSPGSGEERQGVQVSAEGGWENLTDQDTLLGCFVLFFSFSILFNREFHIILLNFLHVMWLLTNQDDLKIFWRTWETKCPSVRSLCSVCHISSVLWAQETIVLITILISYVSCAKLYF